MSVVDNNVIYQPDELIMTDVSMRMSSLVPYIAIATRKPSVPSCFLPSSTASDVFVVFRGSINVRWQTSHGWHQPFYLLQYRNTFNSYNFHGCDWKNDYLVTGTTMNEDCVQTECPVVTCLVHTVELMSSFCSSSLHVLWLPNRKRDFAQIRKFENAPCLSIIIYSNYEYSTNQSSWRWTFFSSES